MTRSAIEILFQASLNAMKIVVLWYLGLVALITRVFGNDSNS
jgi:hypothetical protein